MAESNRIYGYLKSFSKGINSDVDPLLLPADQLSFATNATMRGNFVKQRPNFFNLQLTDTTGGTTLAAFQQGLFQGACYFRATDGSIMVAVNGKLFQITIADQIATVVLIPLPDSNQSTTQKQCTLWQAEQFLLFSDKTNLPIYCDGSGIGWGGVLSRRSFGLTPTSLGSVALDATSPQQNQIVSITLNGNWTAGTGMVLIDGAQYHVDGWTNSGTGANIQTMSLLALTSFTQNSYVSAGTIFNTNSKYCGFILSATDANGNAISTFANGNLTLGNSFFQNSVAHTTGVFTDFRFTNVPANSLPLIDYPYCASVGYSWMYPPIYTSQFVDYTTGVARSFFTINGANCTIKALTPMPSSDSGGAVRSLDFTPATASDYYSLLTTSTLAFVFPYFDIFSAGFSKTVTNTITGGIKVTLDTPFSGSIGDTLTIGATTLKVVSFLGSSVTCVVMTGSGNSIPFKGAGLNSNSVVVNSSVSSPVLSAVGTYPLYQPNVVPNTVSPNVSISSQGVISSIGLLSSSIVYGSILTAATSSGQVTFVVTTTSGGGTGTVPVIQATNINDTAGKTIRQGEIIYSIPELPICGVGVYGMGRNWVSLSDGTSFVAGDLVGSYSGSSPFKYSDAVLKCSQNYFLAGGGTFKISSSGEKINAMQFTAQLDASLGQGALQVFTDRTVFSCQAPSDMSTWSKLTSPILVEGLIGSGAASQDAVTQANSDLIFRLSNGEVQSMLIARLDFNKWGNTPISKEISRVISQDDVSLISYCSSTEFDNRMLMTILPKSADRGVYHDGIVALNFDPISSLVGKQPSIWEGLWSGMRVLKLISGSFNSKIRCFALCLSSGTPATIELREILADGDATLDNATDKVAWSFETPMVFQREQSHLYKRLIDGEIYLDQITGDVDIQAYYKVDQNGSGTSLGWTFWYGTTIKYKTGDSGFRPRVGLGMPSPKSFDETNNRPTREGYDFQVKLVITGSCRFLGGRFAADIIPQPDFAKPI
jgi:hypothetical protein